MFREDKATQMAAKFLKLRSGRLEYIHLLKMMYMSDKAMLLKRGSPITYDKWASLDKGPILSNTYNLIKHDCKISTGVWYSHIETDGIDAVLSHDPADGALSRSEEAVIEQIFREVGKKDRWDVVDLTHTFPEWTFPDGSSLPIKYETVLSQNGRDDLVPAMVEMKTTQEAIASLAR